MPHAKHRPRPRPHAPPLLSTVWLPGPDDGTVHEPTLPPAVLPAWAIARIRTEFACGPDKLPAPLRRIHIRDTEPGMDTRTPCATYTDTDTDTDTCDGNREASSPPILLAELHPDTLPDAGMGLTDTSSDIPGAMEDGWPGFFHRAHRLLPANGLLLLATRQRRDAGRLTDPLGALIACARTAGFRYLQHLVVAHGHPVDGRIAPAPPEAAPPGLIHSDLLLLAATVGE